MVTAHSEAAVSSSSSVWPPDLLALQQSFLLSSRSDERARQIQLIRSFSAKFGIERISKHSFEWVQYSSGPIREEWLPVYVYKKNLSVSEVWEEWEEGIDGGLSVRQLNKAWEARWRRNAAALKTEASRRKHIINLITQLSEQPHWSVPLALRFLNENFTIPGPGYLASSTTFAKQLQSKVHGQNTLAEILESASVYCK